MTKVWSRKESDHNNMAQKKYEELIESLRNIVDWDSYEVCFPSDIQPSRKKFLTYLAKQLVSQIAQGYKPISIGVTDSF